MSITTTFAGSAFGLSVECEAPLLGLDGVSKDRIVRNRLVRVETPEEPPSGAWTEATPVAVRVDDGRLRMAIEAHHHLGLRIFIDRLGSYVVDPAANRVSCHRAEGSPDLEWQRALACYVLPFTALLHGLEVLHAGAVDIGGDAIAVVGRSGAGKTSAGLRLRLRGAGFLTDDALAVEVVDGVVVAHPGPGVANLPGDQLEILSRADRARAGRVFQTEGDEHRALVRRITDPRPLRAIYVLEHSAGGPLQIERVADPFVVLGMTFNLALRTESRLRRHFEISEAIARTVGVHRVSVPPGCDAEAVADALHAHVGGVR